MIIDIYCGDVSKWFIASHLNQVYQVCINPNKLPTEMFLLCSGYFCSH